ncbi:uncharacterized protein N7482_004692 [Penicillium canariense]|uniref:DNA endonuclease activator Ctp1 C-terminal domain-containing protein n=1 Tax=Penicillium canariense TaxID=189055 RepID=A0A9W9I977_9EURO|nr:uncharacterized protein N7482_004692 [Penicillium canariense]KAJ5169098.1 hypothetical protein N7482_004692 [Penicillium canariense]
MEILKDLHTSITEVCKASFDDAYKKLESRQATHEAQVKTAERKASIAIEAQQAAEQRVQELQLECSALRDELGTYKNGPSDLELPAEITNLEREFAPKNIWRTDLLDADQLREILEDKYTTLYTDMQAFIRSWSSLKSKLLQHKKKLRLWDKQLARESFTILLDQRLVTFQRVQSTNAMATGNNRKSSIPGTRMRTQSASENSEGPSNVPSIIASTPNIESRAESSPKITTEENSQQTDADEPGVADIRRGPATAGGLPSSESTSDVLHSLPNLQTRKRKRVLPSSQGQPKEGAAERPVLVKAEIRSSSPIHQSAYGLGQHFPSTQDLDEIGGAVPTPTKRHAHREVHWEDEDEDEEEESVSGTQQAIADQVSQHQTVLQPVDGNVRTARPWGKGPDMKRQKVGDLHALSMAEDGDSGDGHNRTQKHNSKSTPANRKGTPKSKADGKAASDRLQGLLEGSLPSKSPLGSPKKVLTSSIQNGGGSSNPRRNGRTIKATPPGPHAEQPDKQASQTGPEVQPEEEPYRSRPLHRLNLDHFKINPARNQGLDYAYDTVVRKKDDRKCMSGCTRPGCCGDRFRAMARMGIQGANASAESKEEDQQILEEYVGEDRHLLHGLSDKNRENLLVEARARVLADQYGRHRHTHQRARSPPGFWRTDMPSTQEIETDREAARRMEREKVEERYREAMRPGGLWTWADE